MNETARVINRYATVQESPRDHKGGYSPGRDELVVEPVDHDQGAGGRAAAHP